jgi:hypothetical protein
MDNKNRKEYYGVEEPYYKVNSLVEKKSLWKRHRWKIIAIVVLALMVVSSCTTVNLLRVLWPSISNSAHLTPQTSPSSSVANSTNPMASGLPCNVNIGAWTGGSPDWVVHNNTLYDDGSNGSDNGPTAIAPCQPSTTNYAVEAKIQLTNLSGSCFGIVVRASSTQSGWQGYKAGICNSNLAYIAAYGDFNPMSSASYAPGTILRTYRCEVKDNTIKLFIDGTLVVAASDNRLLTQQGNEQVGLFAQNLQIQVSSFQVTAL